MSARVAYLLACVIAALLAVTLVAIFALTDGGPPTAPGPEPVPPCLVPGGGTPNVPTPA